MTKLSIEFDRDEQEKLEVIKKETGIKQTTEVIRNLITVKFKEIQASQISQVNSTRP